MQRVSERAADKWKQKEYVGSTLIVVSACLAARVYRPVFITTRDETKAREVIADILKSNEGISSSPLEHIFLDLTSLDSVREAASAFLKRSSKLNVLINNAGVCLAPPGKTKEGFELHFGVNHLAHFLLTKLLTPALLAAATPAWPSRVVNVSSNAHRFATVNLDDLQFEKVRARQTCRCC